MAQPGSNDCDAGGVDSSVCLGTRNVPFHGIVHVGGDASKITEEWNSRFTICKI